MATIRFHETTTATPEQFIAGLTDFGPDRSELFKNSADAYLDVHSLTPPQADVDGPAKRLMSVHSGCHEGCHESPSM